MGKVKINLPGEGLSQETADLLGGASGVDEGFRHVATRIAADIRSYPAKEAIQAGDVVDVVGGAVEPGTQVVGGFPVGTIIKLNENGTPIDYVIVHQGLPSSLYDASCNGTWVLRKDVLEVSAWHSSNVNDYANSTIKTYLDSTVLNRFDTITKAAIKQAKIPYRPGRGTSPTVNSGANGLSCKIFLLSAYELGWTNADNANMPADGAKLSYFDVGTGTAASNKRIANLGGAPRTWWLRSPGLHASTSAWGVSTAGTCSVYDSTTPGIGVLPAFILDSSHLINVSAPSQAIALTSAAAGKSCEVIFDGVASVPWATKGQTITSPGVQGYAPQDGWLWVKPEWDAKPFVAGTYTGDGASSRDIDLGFTPSAVILSNRQGGFGSPWNQMYYGGFALHGFPCIVGNNSSSQITALEIVDGGFRLKGSDISRLNETDNISNPYRFIAFR